MYKFFQCQKQMFLDSELEIYYDLLKNDQILLQCMYLLILFAVKNDTIFRTCGPEILHEKPLGNSLVKLVKEINIIYACQKFRRTN